MPAQRFDRLAHQRGLGLLREGQILRAAVVLFARSDRLLPDYPQCLLRVARFKGLDKTEFLDNRQFYGNAFDLLVRADRFLQFFFANLIERQALVSLYDFENREGVFPGVHRSYKFCLLTLSDSKTSESEFVFFATNVSHLSDPFRRFRLPTADIALMNPNTKTMPIFRTASDAALTRAIYLRLPVLVNEKTGENPWGFDGLLMFMMNTDSKLFAMNSRADHFPLYEGKMLWQFDSRWATYEKDEVRELTLTERLSPEIRILSRYWVPITEVNDRLGDWSASWLLAFRDITNSTNERTSVFALLPRVGVGNNAPVVILRTGASHQVACFLTNANSIVFDFVARQKVGGMHLNFFILKQLPFLPPAAYTSADITFIMPRVLELAYTAWDMAPFAADLFREIGILDPKDVYGPDFPGETFRVLKEKEERAFGEYRSRRLVLDAWDRLEAELGPVVMRNYREEMGVGSSEIASRESVGARTPSVAARPVRKVAEARLAYQTADQPTLLDDTPAPHLPLSTPHSLLPTPPSGNRSQRLSRLLTLGRQRTPEAIGDLVAALGDEDEQLRWLAALSLQGIGGGTVIATLKAFIDQAPSAIAREEAEKVLDKLTELGG